MYYLYKSKLKSVAQDFVENKILSSALFNILCTILYYQYINKVLNIFIVTHLTIIAYKEIFNYVNLMKKNQLMKKQMANVYTQRQRKK